MNPPEQIEALSRSRSAEHASLYISWKHALAALPPLPAGDFETLATALPSPASARHFAAFLMRESDPQEAVAQFLKAVDDSEEDLPEWLSAFAVFARFIDQTAHRPNLTEATGYLHCCEAVIGSGVRYATFSQTAETMLATYGFDGEQGHLRPD